LPKEPTSKDGKRGVLQLPSCANFETASRTNNAKTSTWADTRPCVSAASATVSAGRLPENGLLDRVRWRPLAIVIAAIIFRAAMVPIKGAATRERETGALVVAGTSGDRLAVKKIPHVICAVY
jgi:hypothetical protein